MTTLDIQRRLKTLGFDPGPLDGVRGRLTIAAIRAFQVSVGLDADGIAGPQTLAKLGAQNTSSSPDAEFLQLRPWYAEAVRLQGVREAAGAADNPMLLSWARRLSLAYPRDSIAWCGLFAAHCVGLSLPEEPLPANPLGARNWLRFGVATEPGLGAVLVFWRGTKAGWQGHVGFYAGEDSAAFHVLGGNQRDRVCITRIAKTRCLGARWPLTGPAQTGGRALSRSGGALSINEA
jgi:uncharacterized protein (TIGR02594 family)